MPKRHNLFIFGLFIILNNAYATNFIFNPKLINAMGSNVDLSAFDHNQESPGLYYVKIFLNGKYVDSRSLTFNRQKKKRGASQLDACLSTTLLTSYGINMAQFISKNITSSNNCFNINTIPHASINFNFNQQSIYINVPQIYLKSSYSGITQKKLWNNGINAFFINYAINSSYTQSVSYHQNSIQNNNTIELSPGLNIGAWRIRGAESWQKTSGSNGQWNSANIYATRGLYNLNSRITVGQSYTDGNIFGSFPFEGVMLSSDTQMVPSAQFSYAPVVRGVASSQARVEIAENGTILYNQIVAPGPFSISNFTPLDSNGVLNVTIWDKNGKTHQFNVAFSTPIIALKQNYFEYNVILGKYRLFHRTLKDNAISQGEIIYGLPANITAYAGFQLSAGFSAYSLGLGVSMGKLGGLSLDTTINKIEDKQQTGRQFRLRYNTKISNLGTSLSLIDIYNNPYYSSLSAYFNHHLTILNSTGELTSKKSRNSLQLNISQPLSSESNFYLNGILDNYWNSHNDSLAINTGVAIHLPKLNHSTLSLQFSNTHLIHTKEINDNRVSLFISIPLEEYLGFNTQLVYRYISPLKNQQRSNVIELSGNSADEMTHWDLGQQFQKNSYQSTNSGYINGLWNTPYGYFGANYNYSDNDATWGLSATGGLLVYDNANQNSIGLLLIHPIQGASALIEAPGASDSQLTGLPGVQTNEAGNAVISYLMPYQKNSISIDPVNLPNNVSINHDNTTVIPTQDAIVVAKFKTEIGAHAVIKLLGKNGTPFPFGSIVINQQDKSQSVIGLNGEAYLTGLGKSGFLLAKSNKYQCMIHYTLPPKPINNMDGIYEFNAQCQ